MNLPRFLFRSRVSTNALHCGHLSVGLAAKPAAPRVSLGVLLLASWILDVFAIGLGFTSVEGAEIGDPWSHGLFMSVVWAKRGYSRYDGI